MSHQNTDALYQVCCAELDAHLQRPLLLVGYSGGVDSHVLLCLLARYVAEHPECQLQAVHVHHGLNRQADAWARHCQQICAGLGVALAIEPVTLAPGPRESLEAKARDARYAVLSRHLPTGGSLITAHHQDDQLETLLLALKRGAGPRGLAGMPVCQPFSDGQLLRPLLFVPRTTIVQWAQAHRLNWIEDDSNQNEQFDRNFLRQQIIPKLKARWPALGLTAGRSARLCAEQESLALELAELDLTVCRQANGSLGITELTRLSPARQHNVLRHWWRGQTGSVPSYEQLCRVWSEVVLARDDANPQLVTQSGVLRRYRHCLYLQRETSRASPDRALYIDEPCDLICGRLTLQAVAKAAHLRYPEKTEGLQLKFDLPGSTRLRPLGRSGSRTLKKLWQEYSVAPWWRPHWPILCYGEAVAAIPGLFVCEGFEAQSASGLCLEWVTAV